MWPIFHNVDQLDSIHAAWRLKKLIPTAASNASLSNKKVSGLVPAVTSALEAQGQGQGQGSPSAVKVGRSV